MANREIKFRAWDASNGRMEYEMFYVFQKSGKCFFPEYKIVDGKLTDEIKSLYDCGEEEPILMQYTGLKDKNGVEIYDGDIVGGYPHGTVIVRWCKEYACFEAVWEDEDENGNIQEYTSLFANELDNCKDAWIVLGNVYEHPHLLNQDNGK